MFQLQSLLTLILILEALVIQTKLESSTSLIPCQELDISSNTFFFFIFQLQLYTILYQAAGPLWVSISSSKTWEPLCYSGNNRVVGTAGWQGISLQGVWLWAGGSDHLCSPQPAWSRLNPQASSDPEPRQKWWPDGPSTERKPQGCRARPASSCYWMGLGQSATPWGQETAPIQMASTCHLPQ